MDVRGNSWRPGSMAARRRAVPAERQRGWSRCRDRLARADTCQRGGSLLGAGPCGPFLAFRRDGHRSTAVLSVEGGVGDRVNEFVTEVGGAIVIRDVAIELDRRERPELHKPPVHRLRHRGGRNTRIIRVVIRYVAVAVELRASVTRIAFTDLDPVRGVVRVTSTSREHVSSVSDSGRAEGSSYQHTVSHARCMAGNRERHRGRGTHRVRR